VTELMQSYALANGELVASFVRWLKARGVSEHTIREYARAAEWFTEYLGPTSVAEATRADILGYLRERLVERGVSASRINVDTCGLRSFFRFLLFAEVTRLDPLKQIAHRKMPGPRIPRLLSIEEVEALIRAARNPLERAVVEVLYSTGVRLSELCNIRLENIDQSRRTILIKKGKGGQDRYVLFGQPAAKAIADYQAWRPSKIFLFEAPARGGSVRQVGGAWHGVCYVNSVQHEFSIGSVSSLPTKRAARREFERIASKIDGFEPWPQRQYQPRALYQVLCRVAPQCARIKGVHPHALRRAMACHMLARGANIRVIQELLGHAGVTTTQLYTHLTPHELKAIHQRCHPHEQEERNAKTKA
jgi:site-specific recombinase XerD